MTYGYFPRRMFVLILVAIIMFTPFLATATEKTIQIIVNGKIIETKDPPVIVNDRVMVTGDVVTSIFYGFTITPALLPNETIEFSRDYITIILKLDGTAIVNEDVSKIDPPAQFIDGIYYVPLRFIAEKFGSTVKWDDETKTVEITTDTDKSMEKTLIENSTTDLYSSQHMGFSTVIPQGSFIFAAPYSDNVLVYLAGSDFNETNGIMQIMAFPEASKTLGNRKGEDIMLEYFRTEAAKDIKYPYPGMYGPSGMEILEEKDIYFLGEATKQITYRDRPIPETVPNSAFYKDSVFKYITAGLTKNDTFYQVRMLCSPDEFERFLPAYNEAVKNFIIFSPPKIKHSEITPQVIDVSPIYDLKLTSITNIAQVDSLKGVKAELFDSPEKAIEAFNNNIEYSLYYADLFGIFGWEFDLKEQFTWGGEGYNRYCYSCIKQLRGDSEGGKEREDAFASSVWFLKNNLVIEITEVSREPVSHKDEVIKYIAELLATSN